ncbi:hypothetical protein EMCRGX_G016062 [Ephydatia muelleri]|eukprot:Em0008g1124a
MACFGVRLGSAAATVAAYKAGKTDVIANDYGERSTPMMVCYLDTETIVGQSAKQALQRHGATTAWGMALLIGRNLADPVVQEIAKGLLCKVVKKDGELCYSFEINGKERVVSARSALIEMLKKLLEVCKSYDSSSPTKAVITSPADFGPEQKKILSQCAISAGFKVLRVISEPAACTLAYGLGQEDRLKTQYVLVYDWGKWTFSAAILQVIGGLCRTVAMVTTTAVGGHQLDSAIVDLLLSDFQRQWKADLRGNSRAVHKLRMAAEEAKHTLSSNQTATIHIDSIHEGIDYQYTLTRGRFEGICATPIRNGLGFVTAVLEKANMEKSRLTHVALAGGSCRVPRLQQLVTEEFPSCEVLCSVPSDEVVAIGGAIEAGLLQQRGGTMKEEGTQHIPCCSQDLWLTCPDANTSNSSPILLLTRHTPLPCSRDALIRNLKPLNSSQDTLSIELHEGTEAEPIAKILVPAAEEMELLVSIEWLRDDKVTLSAKQPLTNWTTQLSLHCSAPV